MTNPIASSADWLTLVQKIGNELAALSTADRQWLCTRLSSIQDTQVKLDELFRKAGGIGACSDCDGECCGCGRHHLTLTNLLIYLVNDELPPEPDFGKTCPYLGERGCQLPVDRRPYNCITFFCETLEDRLDDGDRTQLRELDYQLRSAYEQIAARYPAASLRGIWIATERLDGGLFF